MIYVVDEYFSGVYRVRIGEQNGGILSVVSVTVSISSNCTLRNLIRIRGIAHFFVNPLMHICSAFQNVNLGLLRRAVKTGRMGVKLMESSVFLPSIGRLGQSGAVIKPAVGN